MGCAPSKHTIATWRIDDSVHVALKRDKKGNAPKHYTPRAPHPLLMPKKYPNTIVDDSTMKTSCCESDEFIIFHTASRHCDTIDPSRDLREAKLTSAR
jgi:hypothetical protein